MKKDQGYTLCTDMLGSLRYTLKLTGQVKKKAKSMLPFVQERRGNLKVYMHLFYMKGCCPDTEGININSYLVQWSKG